MVLKALGPHEDVRDDIRLQIDNMGIPSEAERQEWWRIIRAKRQRHSSPVIDVPNKRQHAIQEVLRSQVPTTAKERATTSKQPGGGLSRADRPTIAGKPAKATSGVINQSQQNRQALPGHTQQGVEDHMRIEAEEDPAGSPDQDPLTKRRRRSTGVSLLNIRPNGKPNTRARATAKISSPHAGEASPAEPAPEAGTADNQQASAAAQSADIHDDGVHDSDSREIRNEQLQQQQWPMTRPTDPSCANLLHDSEVSVMVYAETNSQGNSGQDCRNMDGSGNRSIIPSPHHDVGCSIRESIRESPEFYSAMEAERLATQPSVAQEETQPQLNSPAEICNPVPLPAATTVPTTVGQAGQGGVGDTHLTSLDAQHGTEIPQASEKNDKVVNVNGIAGAAETSGVPDRSPRAYSHQQDPNQPFLTPSAAKNANLRKQQTCNTTLAPLQQQQQQTLALNIPSNPGPSSNAPTIPEAGKVATQQETVAPQGAGTVLGDNDPPVAEAEAHAHGNGAAEQAGIDVVHPLRPGKLASSSTDIQTVSNLPSKRGRGRPRKQPLPEQLAEPPVSQLPKNKNEGTSQAAMPAVESNNVSQPEATPAPGAEHLAGTEVVNPIDQADAHNTHDGARAADVPAVLDTNVEPDPAAVIEAAHGAEQEALQNQVAENNVVQNHVLPLQNQGLGAGALGDAASNSSLESSSVEVQLGASIEESSQHMDLMPIVGDDDKPNPGLNADVVHGVLASGLQHQVLPSHIQQQQHVRVSTGEDRPVRETRSSQARQRLAASIADTTEQPAADLQVIPETEFALPIVTVNAKNRPAGQDISRDAAPSTEQQATAAVVPQSTRSTENRLRLLPSRDCVGKSGDKGDKDHMDAQTNSGGGGNASRLRTRASTAKAAAAAKSRKSGQGQGLLSPAAQLKAVRQAAYEADTSLDFEPSPETMIHPEPATTLIQNMNGAAHETGTEMQYVANNGQERTEMAADAQETANFNDGIQACMATAETVNVMASTAEEANNRHQPHEVTHAGSVPVCNDQETGMERALLEGTVGVTEAADVVAALHPSMHVPLATYWQPRAFPTGGLPANREGIQAALAHLECQTNGVEGATNAVLDSMPEALHEPAPLDDLHNGAAVETAGQHHDEAVVTTDADALLIDAPMNFSQLKFTDLDFQTQLG